MRQAVGRDGGLQGRDRNYSKIRTFRAREMVQCLRVLAAFAEDLGSVPGTTAGHNHL